MNKTNYVKVFEIANFENIVNEFLRIEKNKKRTIISITKGFDCYIIIYSLIFIKK